MLIGTAMIIKLTKGEQEIVHQWYRGYGSIYTVWKMFGRGSDTHLFRHKQGVVYE